LPYDPSEAGNGPIAAGGSVARRLEFTLPDGTAGAGDFQITVVTDWYGQVFEHDDPAPGGPSRAYNHAASTTVTAALAPYPPLGTSAVPPPARPVAAPARVPVGGTVPNPAPRPTAASWVDAVVLSPDGDPAYGQVLARFTHAGVLAVGGGYSRSETFLL